MEPTPIDKIAIALLFATKDLAKFTHRPQMTLIMDAIDSATLSISQNSLEQNRAEVGMLLRLAHISYLMVDDNTPA
jgi:hypothetical protein